MVALTKEPRPDWDVAWPGVRLADLADAVYATRDPAHPMPVLTADQAAVATRISDAVHDGFEELGADAQFVLVDAATTLLEQVYAHLPLKRARYATDPVQRLRLLRRRCGAISGEELHGELARVITELRDGHTRYIGPTSLAGCVAALPFLVEEYGPPGDRHYLVTKTAANPDVIPPGSGFAAGVEAISWNGTPFARAVERISDNFFGSHPDARRARGLESLTLRSLQYGPLPDEHWVLLGYLRPDGTPGEIRFDWRVFTPAPAGGATPDDPNPAALALGVDHEGEAVHRAKAALFAPRRRARRALAAVDSDLSGALTAGTLETSIGRVGYLRIWNFAVEDHLAFVNEIRRLVGRLPDRGLIVDVRGNPGGLIWAAERALQLFVPTAINPTRFSLPVTELTVALAANDGLASDLGPWRASLEAAVFTGELYSQPIPLTDPAMCNDVGQTYGGPVVCIADARTYSAGDLFASGFVDNNIGPLITVGAATGGGGANVWTYGLLQTRLTAAGTPAPILPAGCGFTFSFRRATRSGANDGRPIEDAGVAGTVTHTMTRADLLRGNRDLIEAAAELLAAQRCTRLRVTQDHADRTLVARSDGLDLLRVTFDDTATSSHRVRPANATLATTTLATPGHWHVASIEGWGAGQLLQRRRIVATRDRASAR